MENIGIDVHKRESQICIVSEQGEVFEQRSSQATALTGATELKTGKQMQVRLQRQPGGPDGLRSRSSSGPASPWNSLSNGPMPYRHCRTLAKSCVVSTASVSVPPSSDQIR